MFLTVLTNLKNKVAYILLWRILPRDIFGRDNCGGTFAIVLLDFEVTIFPNVSPTLEEHLLKTKLGKGGMCVRKRV